MPHLVLSLFPGVGLLDRAFEAEGFCVVRGPDKIFGGDVRSFKPPEGVFWGVIGGPPCQDFSGARRVEPTGYGLAMLDEFARVVVAASPCWWLCENVARVPDVEIAGYNRQRLDVNADEFSGQRRLRHIQYGTRDGDLLDVPRRDRNPNAESPAMASDGRSFRELCRLQGLPDDFDLPDFNEKGRKRAVGNGVPLPMGRELARAVLRSYRLPARGDIVSPGDSPRRVCACGCGRTVGGLKGRQRYAGPTCRKRAQRARDAKP